MSLSRQQRRAQARAEAKRARQPRPTRVYEVEVHTLDADPGDLDDEAGWTGECGLQGESVGVELEWTTDFTAIIESGRECAQAWADRYELTMLWTLDGREEAMTEAATAAGIELPAIIR